MKAMYLCQYHKMEKESEFAVAFLVIVLCSLSAYFISDFAGNTQLRILSGKECLGAYKKFALSLVQQLIFYYQISLKKR